MHTIEEVVSKMPEVKYFTKLDVKSAFWQISLLENSSYYVDLSVGTNYVRKRWNSYLRDARVSSSWTIS